MFARIKIFFIISIFTVSSQEMVGMEIVDPTAQYVSPDTNPTSSLGLWDSLQLLIVTPETILQQMEIFLLHLKEKDKNRENITNKDIDKLKLFWTKFRSAHNYNEFDRKIRPFRQNINYSKLANIRKKVFYFLLHPDKYNTENNKKQMTIAFQYYEDTSRPSTGLDSIRDTTSIILIKTAPNIVIHQSLTGGMSLTKKIFPGFLRSLHLEKQLFLFDKKIDEYQNDTKFTTTITKKTEQAIRHKSEILRTKIDMMKQENARKA